MGNLAETEVIIIAAFGLTLITTLFHAIGVIAPYWVYRDTSGTQQYQGLWQICTNVDSNEECGDISVKPDWLEAAEALELIGIILLCLVIVGFFVHVFLLRGDKVLYIIIAVVLFVAGIFILIGAAIYAGNVGATAGTVHFSFALCLTASVLAVIIAFIMLIYLLSTLSKKKSDEEWSGAGPSNSQWIAPRGKSAHKSITSIINETDDAEEQESRPKTAERDDDRAKSGASARSNISLAAASPEEDRARGSTPVRGSTRSETGKTRRCCYCCFCCNDDGDNDEDSENQRDIEERQEEDPVLQDYDENEEMNDTTENQDNDKPESDSLDEKEYDSNSDKGIPEQETSQKLENANNETKENSNKEAAEGSQNFKSVQLLDVTDHEEHVNVVILNKEDDTAMPTESNTDDPDETLYAQVHPESSAETNQSVISKESEAGSKASLKEDETIVVIPDEANDETDSRKKRGTVFKFRRPPLKRSKSDGTVLKAKVQMYEVSQKDNKMVLVSSDYVPDEDIQSLSRTSSNNTSATALRHIDEIASEDKQSHEDKESEFEDEYEETNQTGEFRTIKIRTRKRTKRVKVKGIFGNPVHSPYGYTHADAEHKRIVRYLKTSPYFSTVPVPPIHSENSNTEHSEQKERKKPKWKI